jgi:hypothetical protein
MSNTRKLRGRDWAPAAARLDKIIAAAGGRVPPGVMEALVQPGYADQAAAARAEALPVYLASIDAAAARYPGRAVTLTPHDEPQDIIDQVHGLFLRVVSEMSHGERRHCPHLADWAPVPAVAPACCDWVACHRCEPLPEFGGTRPALTEEEDHTCDLCGGYRHRQTIHGVQALIGFVTLIYGVCPDCSERMGAGR